MSSFTYPAIFTLEHNVYEVEFPDLDGCLTYGMNMQEAFSNAQEALTGYKKYAYSRCTDNAMNGDWNKYEDTMV